MLTQAVPLKLSFKGNRDYITGADIAQEMLSHLGACSQVRIEFHQIASRALCMYEVSADQLPDLKQNDNVYAWLTCMDASGLQRYWLACAQAQAVQLKRLDYDESFFTRFSVLDESGIYADENSLKSRPIDALVALNKLMLNQYVEVHPWVFVRLDLHHWPLEVSHVFLKCPAKASLGLYKTQILCGDAIVGAVYFTRRPMS